jgi:hypothetical protein
MGIRSRTSRFAHVVERVGLAMAGASCGLFVAAHLGRTGIEILTSLAAIFAMTAYGAIAFYLGIDIPPHAALAGKTDPAEILSAIGTFLATIAAFISVFIIVADEDPDMAWTISIGACWLIGVTLQIVAGAIARTRAV